MSYSPDNIPETMRKAPLSKRARKAVYKQIARLRDTISDMSPNWLRRFFAPIYDYAEMIFVDHGMFRTPYANRHKVSERAWRSSQPWPHQIRYYAQELGIRTILNLRGPRDCGSDRLERKACEDYGIVMRDDLQVRSRGAPSRTTILGLRDYFSSLQYPILLHCKAGADRASLISALYLIIMEDVPVEKAREQLSMRFGHFKQAKTGILDHFFEQYLAYKAVHDISFMEWVETVYDEDGLMNSFQSERWTSLLVDRILNRE
ncbi:protein tyrosine phosphatase [Cohaesibacter haloalkalitolerans]|uniref:protein tyrosine phosphatase n=1 Tax=Cohaesibacter haloalkalitolerans TaxID=1162980 RepID=UPI001FDFB865|nr:protein tyrosine phosphatase [Cohaesibacter haloalkalitolerans]